MGCNITRHELNSIIVVIDRDILNPAWRVIEAKMRRLKPAKPAVEKPIEWPRADPLVLVNFDPASKTCNMNCGAHGLDPRSREERLFLCDDC